MEWVCDICNNKAISQAMPERWSKYKYKDHNFTLCSKKCWKEYWDKYEEGEAKSSEKED